jgi:hypothetical protein
MGVLAAAGCSMLTSSSRDHNRRPDIGSFKAYMLNKAAPGAKVATNVTASLLPSIEGRERGAKAFEIMSSALYDDSEAFNFLCAARFVCCLLA